MTALELRQKYLDFFKSKGHAIIPSASLVPRETDATVLFTTAGMHPLVPYLLGEDHPGGRRVANVQKCVRTIDIDEVGDNRHNTFFEMMGNWSFGDYFKKEAIEWSFEFLTDPKWLGLDPKRLYVTVFRGEDGIPRDEESIKIWQEVFAKAGISNEVAGEDGIIKNNIRIIPLGTDDNFWIASSTGPCGPDTEMFYDTAPEIGEISDNFHNLVNNFRLIEIWNNVFMEFNKTAEGEYEKLAQQNVDTGMGVERTLAVLNGQHDVFDTELFSPIFSKISEITKIDYYTSLREFRIIADHVKASAFMISDGVEPSNVMRGYVLRRIIRRAIRYGKQLGIESNFTKEIAEVVIDTYKYFYKDLEQNKNKIFSELEKEENKFRETLGRGIKKFQEVLVKIKKPSGIGGEKIEWIIPGKDAFDLYQTFGFPIEIIKELAGEQHIKVDEKGYQDEFNKHQELSKTAAAGQFKGGLAEASETTARLHTATHLLLAALREVLGPHVYQKGSNITPERLRVDFAHNSRMTPEELEKAQNWVNEAIREDVSMKCQEMTVEEAKSAGAIGVFDSKYGDKVKVYKAGNYSQEICGGPHAKTTGELGHFKIVKEEASSAGVRRIKAVLE
jgi:alanyl-tRNA synthetase